MTATMPALENLASGDASGKPAVFSWKRPPLSLLNARMADVVAM